MDTQRLTGQTAEDLSILDRAFPLGLAQQPQLRPGERRPVAVLFFNLRGIGSLEAVSSIEQPVQLRNGILRLLGRLVEAYGGYVDKYSGGRIMALFGARLAGENDSVRAAETALRMMETIDEVCESFGIPADTLSPVAGITFGEVTVAPDPSGHLTATGTPVNLAARLESMAEAGQVLAGGALRKQCRDAIECEDLGQMEVKGLSKPAHVFLLEDLSKGASGWNPVRVSRRELPFVNRNSDLETIVARIVTHLEDPQSPNLLVVLEGEAGLGKSRLAREALRKAGVEEYAVGHTRPYAQPPFWLWTTLLQHLLDRRSQQRPAYGELKGLLQEVQAEADPFTEQEAQALAHLLSLPESKDMDRLGDRLRRDRIRFAVLKLTDALTNRNRNVFLLDDLQWADTASLEMLSLVLAQPRRERPLIVMATAREVPSGLPESDSLRIHRLPLDPLGTEHCASLAAEAVGYSGRLADDTETSSLTALVQRYCGGNPLFVEELSTAVSETGLLAAEDGRLKVRGDLASIRVPSTLSALVRARLDKLPRHLRTAAQVAAVIGDDLERSLAAAVLERLGEHGTSTGSIDDLVDMGILNATAAGALAFRHGMVRKAAYESILHANRRMLHRLVAEEAEASLRGPRPEVAAANWYAAGEVERAMPHQMEVLRRIAIAEDHNILWRALKDTRRWLSELSDETERSAYRIKLREIELHMLEDEGRIDEAGEMVEELLSAARDLEDQTVLAKILKCYGQYLNTYRNEQLERAKAYLEESLEIGRRLESPAIQADAMGALANLYSDTAELQKSYQLNLKAVELRMEIGALESAASTYTNIANNLSWMGEAEEAAEYFRKSIEMQKRIDDARGLAYSYNGLAIHHAMAGSLDEAEKNFQLSLRNHRKVGNYREEGGVLSNLGTLYKARGQPEKSMRYRREALRICRETGNRRSEAILLENIGNTAREMGDLDKAEEYLDRALELCREMKLQGNEATTLAMQGLLALDRGNTAKAISLYLKAREIVSRTGLARETLEDFCKLRDRLLQAGTPPEEVPLPEGWEQQPD